MFHGLTLLQIGESDQYVVSRVELQYLFLHVAKPVLSIVEHGCLRLRGDAHGNFNFQQR